MSNIMTLEIKNKKEQKNVERNSERIALRTIYHGSTTISKDEYWAKRRMNKENKQKARMEERFHCHSARAISSFFFPSGRNCKIEKIRKQSNFSDNYRSTPLLV
jgi:hypothetical protein